MTTSWSKGRKYLVKMLGALETAGAGVLELAFTREVGPVVLLVEASPVTEALAEAADGAANSMGLDVALRLTFTKGSSDFTSQLKQLKNREIGLLVIFSLQLDDIATLVAQVRASNINPGMMSCLPLMECFPISWPSSARTPTTCTTAAPGIRISPMQAHRNSSKRIAKLTVARQRSSQRLPTLPAKS
jgi:hypothetical protein